jgi:hypothetical protein
MRRATAVTVLAVALGAGAVVLPVDVAGADVVWLCKPGAEPNPCRESLETTVHSSSGESRVENPALPSDPPIDCFYVYPTVSGQPSTNANKDKDPELNAIARYQAARYSQVCRVFAPVYRQQTLAGLGAGGSAAALQLAYGDVREAWTDYLTHENHGRGFVLIGHSQGSRMLRGLLRREIESRSDVRRRLISAVLLGGNVTVRKGQRIGGDFQYVPACAAADDTGCAIAWSTFNETPPFNARYGRVPASDDSGFGFPTGSDYEILCTNPASLSSNLRSPLQTYLRSEPFPGLLGVLLVEMYGGPPPSAPTPWLQPRDHYTGRCERRDGANVLMLEPIAGARRLNPAPDATWGLHLADGNIALGNLVEVVGRQARAFLAAGAAGTAKPKPRLALRLRHRRGRDAQGRRCARPPIEASLVGTGRRNLRRVDFRLGGRLLRRDRTAPFETKFGRSRLRSGRVNRITALAQLKDGRTVRLAGRVRVCAAA